MNRPALNQRGQQAEQVSAPRERGVPLADGPKQLVMPPFDALPECLRFKAPPLDVEKAQDEAMLDAHWDEDEEPVGDLHE